MLTDLNWKGRCAKMILVFVVGLFIGSFLNVCICRIPNGESIVFPSSHCPGCGRSLTPWELIPVISFIIQGCRCKGCNRQISWRYPVVELLTAAVFAAIFTRFSGIDFYIHVLFYGVMIVILFIDLENQIIPNSLVLLLLGLSLLVQLFWPVQPWTTALLGGLLGGSLFLLLAIVSRGGMGGGDIKLVTVLGFWFGWASLLLVLFLAFLGGGLVGGILLLTGLKKRKDGIAFGPFLVLASFIVTMWGKQLLGWYIGISGL